MTQSAPFAQRADGGVKIGAKARFIERMQEFVDRVKTLEIPSIIPVTEKYRVRSFQL